MSASGDSFVVSLRIAWNINLCWKTIFFQPINLIFRYLQNRSRVAVWLFENVNTRIEGHIIGFDEYMNLVMDGAEEVRNVNKFQ